MNISLTSIFSFVKKNWLVLILGFFALRYFTSNYLGYSTRMVSSQYGALSGIKSISSPSVSYDSAGSLSMSPEIAPVAGQNRLVTKDTNLSLQVKDVAQSLNKIQSIAESSGGFLVNFNLSSPESASSGNISIRVPSASRSQVLAQIQALGVKTVSLSVSGQDVTDQYTDNDARLKVLYATQTKFQQIMDQASRVADLLEVQRELINLQSQIDQIKGQQLYLEKSAELSYISVYLSTDELSLPYAPTDAWRPAVIFKTAVRSLVVNLRLVGSGTIWILVYSPVIILALFVYRWLKSRTRGV